MLLRYWIGAFTVMLSLYVDASCVAASAATSPYVLHDFGPPPPSLYPSSTPVGFNNTGQIFGTATTAAKEDRTGYATDVDCLVWTGKSYVDISAAATFESCTPYAMDSVGSANGTFTVVGRFRDIYHLPNGYSGPDVTQVAFAASISSSSGTFDFVPYYVYDPSALYGVNSSGATVGYAGAYYPGGGVFVGAASDTLAFLQPSCASATPSAICLSPIQTLKPFANGQPKGFCAFAGCTVDDSRTVLGVDEPNGFYATYRIGVPSSAKDLSLPMSVHAVAMNQIGKILYGYSAGSGVAAAVYDIVSATPTLLPPVTGTACKYYYPISMNHAGEVLGFTAACSASDFYWTWDAEHGTRQIAASVLPVGATAFAAYGVNDAAQILVSFAASGATHWGILTPAAAAGAHKESRHGR